MAFIQVIKRDSLTYMPVAFRQQRAGAFLSGLGSGEYAFHTAVHLLKPHDLAPEYAPQPFVIAANQEELSVFNDMGEVIVGGVAHISEIYGGRAVAPGSIHPPTESGIFVPFSGRLDHKVGEAPVQDGIECVDVNLVEAPCGFAVRFKKSVGGIRVSERCRRRIRHRQ